MFGKLLGAIVALPVRALNLPAELIDAAVDELTESDAEPTIAEPGRELGDAIERIVEKAVERK